MSDPDIELARRAIETVNDRDLESFLSLMDDDVEIVSRIVAMEGGLRGHAGAKRWWREWFSVFPDYRIEVIEMQKAGDLVLASLRSVGHGAGSELPIEDAIWQGSRWRDGKCTWWRVFPTREEATGAAAAGRSGLEANFELVRRATEALDRGDYEGVLEHWADDAIVDWSRSHGLDARVFRGKREIHSFMVRFREGFEGVRTELVGDPIEVAEGVLVVENVARVEGRDGIEAGARSAFLITIRDGVQTSLTLFQTKEEALAEARSLQEP